MPTELLGRVLARREQGALSPRRLSRQLRDGRGGFIKHRRGIIGLSFTGAGCMGLIALYQMGIIRHLPDLPFSRFSSRKVNASDEAYSHLRMGDAFLGLGSYAATAALAAMAGEKRARRKPWIPLALFGKAAADAAVAAKLTYDQAVKHRAFCSWCLIATGATFGALALAAPEAKAALRALRNRPDTRA